MSERPTLFDLQFGDWVPDQPLWRHRKLEHGWCQYTRHEGVVYRLEVDIQPEDGKPFVATLRHRPDDPHTRMAIPWDLLSYDVFELAEVRDLVAEQKRKSLAEWAGAKALQKVVHVEEKL